MSATYPLYNFSAGPAVLPKEVLERAAEAVTELRTSCHARDGQGIGLSLLELSHRGPEYTAINARAEALCHEVLGIPANLQVLFLQGGASLQFAMVPLNLRRPGRVACYVDTGTWSTKAIQESQVLGETRVLASSAASRFDHLPAIPEIPADAAYVHLTTNNTIYGTEFGELPTLAGPGRDAPLVIDASSHIGSRPYAFDRVSLGYAGAQKNLGPSGVTLVFVSRELLAQEIPGGVPIFLRYATHAKEPSLYNTPNTFGVLVLMLTLEWMRDQGGVTALATRNARKAAKLYAQLDRSSLFVGHARPADRSRMNIPWTLGGAPEAERERLTTSFLRGAEAAGLLGLKGHRSVGGCRASIYNAFPEAGVDALVEYMAEFERTC